MKRTRRIFEERDAVSGDSLAVETDGTRAILRARINDRRVSLVLADRAAVRRLAHALLEALGDENAGPVLDLRGQRVAL